MIGSIEEPSFYHEYIETCQFLLHVIESTFKETFTGDPVSLMLGFECIKPSYCLAKRHDLDAVLHSIAADVATTLEYLYGEELASGVNPCTLDVEVDFTRMEVAYS